MAIVFDALGDVLGVLTRQIGITAGGPDFLGRAAITGYFHLHGVQPEGQCAHHPVLGDELPFLRQQSQYGTHILIFAGQGDGLRVLTLLVLGQFLLEQVRERVVEAVLLKVRPGDAGGIVLR